jgi:predicted short-subunit dehydrogenase-like oxidoreductase (DUF2520 family)
MERIVFVGPGRLGLALGYALSLAESELSLNYCGRHSEPPDHPLFLEGRASYRYGFEIPMVPGTVVILTVRDSAVEEVAVALAHEGSPPAGAVALHCSGALGSDALLSLYNCGYSIGTLHPLEAVSAGVVSRGRFRDSFFAVSGEPEALFVCRRLMTLLEARPITVLTSRRPQYHAAAVIVSNYLITLLELGTRLFQRAGASERDAEAALLALARGTLENVREMGLAHALTGPISRGDIETLELHLRALEPDEARLYAELGHRTLGLVEVRFGPETMGAMEDLFSRYT